jgi:hypothetical protein
VCVRQTQHKHPVNTADSSLVSELWQQWFVKSTLAAFVINFVYPSSQKKVQIFKRFAEFWLSYSYLNFKFRVYWVLYCILQSNFSACSNTTFALACFLQSGRSFVMLWSDTIITYVVDIIEMSYFLIPYPL